MTHLSLKVCIPFFSLPLLFLFSVLITLRLMFCLTRTPTFYWLFCSPLVFMHPRCSIINTLQLLP